MSKTYSLTSVQRIPVSLETAWDFFSNPGNLPLITPPSLRFRIVSEHHGEKMYPGQIIGYKVRPFLNIPIYWMTEITHVEPLRYFIDEQRFGPYQFWHHQHHFKAIADGVEMTDIVHYRLPLWFLGDLAHSLFVHKQLEDIFRFRHQAVTSRFPG